MDGESYHCTLAENIALLRLWSNVPELPKDNPPPAALFTKSTEKRSLTFTKECDIVDNLAFISAISDDHEKVTATCIEEQADHQGMTVILAVNEGDLDVVQESFRTILGILEEVSSRGKQDAKLSTVLRSLTIPTGKTEQEDGQLRRSLLMEIIALNRHRILSRLRSKHAEESIRNQGKPTISSFLVDAVKIGSKVRSLPKGLTAGIAAESKNFERTFEKLEKCASDDVNSGSILADILESAHNLSKHLGFDEFLTKLPNGPPLHPSGRKALLIGIQKIGRYSSACNFLFRAARSLGVFKSLKVEVIKESELCAAPINGHVLTPSLTAALRRLDRRRPDQINQLIQSLASNSGSSPMAEKEKFGRFLNRAVSECKVHAEIQILYHYEMKPVAIMPRVICSSKSACFLCDLFIRFHGKFYVARSHGRLYERWRLPDLQGLGLPSAELEIQKAVFEKFNNEIEDRIRRILLNRRRFSHLHPNESIYMPSPAWTPSRASTDDGIARSSVSNPAKVMVLGNGLDKSVSQQLNRDERTEAPGEILVVREAQSSGKQEADVSISYPENLVQGRKIRQVLQGTKTDLYVIANALHLFYDGSILSCNARSVSHTLQPDETQKSTETQIVDIEWLLDEDAARIRETDRSDVVDVNAMGEGEETTFRATPSEESTLIYVLSFRDVIAIKHMRNPG